MSVTPITAAKANRVRRATATSNFGSGRREAHDASAFYERFVPPELSTDSVVRRPPDTALDVICCADARTMADVPDSSVALVVTSPPYFAGKQYEESLGVDGVPATYFEYLELLSSVFAECTRVLEPGGRIAVNVANLGRRPYRSLSGDVTEILSDLGLLLRGEVIWWKGRAAGGSCAWGSFQRPVNPVLRDVTERVVIASKGRFDRALTPPQRARQEPPLPSVTTISREQFMEATTDLWEIPPESATKVGHPAPFPVALPERLIHLYTYEDDVVLDPFMGSGSTAVAAVRTDRRYIGYDTDPDYVALAEGRVDDERERLAGLDAAGTPLRRVHLPAVPADDPDEHVQARGVREGRLAKELAVELIAQCGFTDLRTDVKPRGLGVAIDVVATDATGAEWAFDISGAFTSSRAGLGRTDTLWKTLGEAAVLATDPTARPLVLITTDAPAHNSTGARALAALTGGPGAAITDVIELLSARDQARLASYATEGRAAVVQPAPTKGS